MKFVANVLLVAGLAAVPAGSAAAQSDEFVAGQPFPLLKLPRLGDGKLVSIEEFRGTRLVLHIWASW